MVPAGDIALANFGRQDPKEIVAAATERATVVAAIIEQRKLYQVISGKRHVQVEGWNTLGAMYGLMPRIAWVYGLDDGGWHAKAELTLIATGQVICAAEAECGSHGDSNWINKASYQQRSTAEEMDGVAVSSRRRSAQAAAQRQPAARDAPLLAVKPSQLSGFDTGGALNQLAFVQAASKRGITVADIGDHVGRRDSGNIRIIGWLAEDQNRTLAGLINEIAAAKAEPAQAAEQPEEAVTTE